MYNERVRQNNDQRSRHFKALKLAIRHKDDEAIKREVAFLSIRSYKPEQVGFSVDDLYHHIENIVVALNGNGNGNRGLRAVYAYKHTQVLKLRKSIGNGTGVRQSLILRRDALSNDLSNIGSKIRYYEQILSIVNDQLKARGIVTEASGTLVPEYTSNPVHA